MKIEKLSENKIKITFNNEYLQKNQVSIHSFLSNSIENQSLFITLLNAAEKEVGFHTENYKIVVENLTQNKDIYTLIISRFSEDSKKPKKSRLHVYRRFSKLNDNASLYKFDNIEIFFNFSEKLLKENLDIFLLLKENNSLFFYNGFYFLAINKLQFDKKILFKITSLFSEFSEYIHFSDVSYRRLKEFGKLLIEKNALYSCTTKK